nr:MAG TPA: Repressor protein CI [Caudoviricetes sp.]
MQLSQKIKDARLSKGWTQDDLAKFSGVSLGSIKRYETGNGNITYSNLQKIINALGVEGSNFVFEGDKFSVSQNVSQSSNLSPKMSPDTSNLKNLSVNQKSNVLQNENFDVSDDVSVDKNDVSPSNLKEVGIDNDEDSNIIAIPYYEDTYASAGYGVINYDEAPTTLKLSESFLRGFLNISGDLSQIHALNSRGDSMEPTITGGELLFVRAIQNELSVISGYVYTINYDGDTFVKRLEKNPVTKTITLFSDNEKYEPIVIKGQNLKSCNIVGRVVAHIKKGVI